MKNPVVLLVEDHIQLAESVGDYLSAKGFELDFAHDGPSALHIMSKQRFDVIILDVMLPGIDGFELCQYARDKLKLDTPIIFLTAREQLDDRLEGFKHGADDYLVKPFEMAELVARINALLQRVQGAVVEKDLRVADLVLNNKTLEVSRGGARLKLSPTGLNILRILMRESPNVVSREQLERELWDDIAPDSDVLRSHLYNLRKVIDRPFELKLLKTLSGLGYKLSDQPD